MKVQSKRALPSTAGPGTAPSPAYDARTLVDPYAKDPLVPETRTYTPKMTRNIKLILTE